MIKRRRWIWVVLFVGIVLLLSTLATTWNIVQWRDYQRIVELAKHLSRDAGSPNDPISAPSGVDEGLWISLVLGTLGFLAALGGLVLFFVKLLHEMRANQLQAEFLATVSHELKTPIATIELSASLLRSGLSKGDLSPEDAQRLWESHDSELKRLREEVETLLEAARWQANTIEVKARPVILEEWLQQCLPRWRQILGPAASLQRKGEPLNVTAAIDPRLMALITDNLIDNARKFAKAAPAMTLETCLLPSDRPWKPARWQLRIEDEGWGFAPEDEKRLFKRFFRARNAAPYAIPGTGLGLYLAANASQALGITIRGESRGPGQGATFILEGQSQ